MEVENSCSASSHRAETMEVDPRACFQKECISLHIIVFRWCSLPVGRFSSWLEGRDEEMPSGAEPRALGVIFEQGGRMRRISGVAISNAWSKGSIWHCAMAAADVRWPCTRSYLLDLGEIIDSRICESFCRQGPRVSISRYHYSHH